MKPQIIAFENPPVNEVVVSAYFDPPLSDFRNEHVGLFWGKIKDEFPEVSQQIPVRFAPEVIDNEFPMPRYWFISQNGINLIQIQQNAFMFNWRRRDEEKYPRFHRTIKPTFDKYYGTFSQFVRTQISDVDPTIDRCELVYINTVESFDFWKGLQNSTNVIPSFSILDPGISDAEAQGFNCNYIYTVETNLQINIGIRAVTNAQQPGSPVLIFEIRAVGSFGGVSKPATDDWFVRAHEAIKSCFVGMTSSEIQNRYWKPVKETL